MRVLSPRIEPPVRPLDGSTASTATRRPAAVSMVPKASMKVLLPTPGTPVTPTRCAPPACGSTAWRTAWARAWCSGLALSTSVMARERRVRSPLRTPAANAAGSGALTRSQVVQPGELAYRAQRRVEDAQPEPVLALVGNRLGPLPSPAYLEGAPAVGG